MSKYFVDNLTHWEKMIIFAPTNNNEIERDMIKSEDFKKNLSAMENAAQDVEQASNDIRNRNRVLGSSGSSLDRWAAHWVRTEVHGIVAVAPNQFLQQTAKGQLNLRVANLDVGIDNRFGSPFACHGIHISTHSDVGSEDIAETDVGITAKGGGVNVRAHGRSNHHLVGIIGSEGV